jgi:uncharacterized protein YijF (DUF1287 family)
VKSPAWRALSLIVLASSLSEAAGAQQPLSAERAAKLVGAAIERTELPEVYDGSYQVIAYPGGDVAEDRGVCTDLVIRSYRALGIDLQKLVHEDMARAFAAYPKLWGLPGPDRNIDHRRVPNLRTFFERSGAELPVSANAADYRAGDLVTWRLPTGLPHIGVVTDRRSDDGRRPLVAHNIGNGPELEDMLFEFEVTGHYRYGGPR